MKMVKDKEILVGADFAGFPLKEAIVEHLKKKGWKVTDIGVRSADEKRSGDVPSNRSEGRSKNFGR